MDSDYSNTAAEEKKNYETDAVKDTKNLNLSAWVADSPVWE